MLNEDLCAGRTNVELAKVDLIVIRGDFLADGGTEEHWQEYVIRHMRYGHYCLYLPLIEQTPPHPFWRLFDPKEK